VKDTGVFYQPRPISSNNIDSERENFAEVPASSQFAVLLDRWRAFGISPEIWA
jgi:hypothetical protein